ncbi:hypothetical protein AA309_23285 [Microvirga vignae]|uniref:Uncharacterized protein n=1 Tax=Microvirga vignae TaxID=1225564 RepID=A0A0H1R747_9HYPH|nr:hypothetical protein [Microvirga vignae]KLK90849.1 hypothetical protein AA309_23285 [Microvirga vignae]
MMVGRHPGWDFTLSVIKIATGNAWNRVAASLVVAGIAALTSILQYIIIGLFALGGTKIVIPDAPTWIGFALIGIGIGVLILGRVVPERTGAPQLSPTPNLHDVDLHQRFREKVTDDVLLFLREHDLGNTFPRKALDPLFDMDATWRGGRYEFSDPELQKSFQEVRSALRVFIGLALTYIHSHWNNPELATVMTDQDQRRGRSQSTLDNARKLNTAATDLCARIDDFERLAAVRLKTV